MLTIFLTITIFALAVLGLAIGVINHRSPLKGSCAGCANCLCRRKQS